MTNGMTMTTFKDNFSGHANIYLRYRPTYPKELFEYLKSLTTEHTLAWDCGTGNGQSAINLADDYESVYASDPSAEQLKNAILNDKVTYAVEKAEQTALENNTVDLVTVAQAVHWFEFDLFYAEVKRVLKKDGVIAVWAYSLPTVSIAFDSIIRDFHDNIIGEFWQVENKMIDLEYTTIPFPFEEITTPQFYIQKKLTLKELLGHFRSWSATQKFIDSYNINPLQDLEEKLLKYWLDENETKEITWKLILKVGRNA
jgi:ubiquinone/menaquinone biosynthesis C-methylase UbiE